MNPVPNLLPPMMVGAFYILISVSTTIHARNWTDAVGGKVKWDDNCLFMGDRLQTINTSKETCPQACQDRPDCTRFFWGENVSGNKGGIETKCLLKGGQGNWDKGEKKLGSRLGDKQHWPSCGWVVARNGFINWQNGATERYKSADRCDYNGNDLETVKAPEDKCGGICVSRDDCTHFTWLPKGGGSCKLKGGSGGDWEKGRAFKTDYDAVCGFKINST